MEEKRNTINILGQVCESFAVVYYILQTILVDSKETDGLGVASVQFRRPHPAKGQYTSPDRLPVL
jgi:hypothetical protein